MRTVSRTAGAMIVLAGLLTLVALTPLLLSSLLPGDGADWARLGDIGEAYGSISALLSAAALVTVGLSLRAQTRQLRASHVQTFAESQTALLRAVMDEPRVYGPILLGREIEDAESETRVRERLFLVLLLRHNWAMYESGNITDAALRHDAFDEIGRGARAREIWREIRPFWTANVGQRPRGRRFIAVLDSVFAAAPPAARPTARTPAGSGPATSGGARAGSGPQAPRSATATGLAVAAGAGAVLAWTVRGRAARR